MVNYDWPGNVRELRNTADRFVLGLWDGFEGQNSVQDNTTGDLATRVQAFEKSVIEREIQSHGGQLKATYESLGLSRKGLYDKMKRLGIRMSSDGSV